MIGLVEVVIEHAFPKSSLMSIRPAQILVNGAKQNNLKSVDLEIEPGRLTVFTGLSGSGKSTLLFDVVHAEGQRKYIETFSPYVRQFLDTLPRPQVESIKNARPSISVEQKNSIRNSRSTVGTMTELCDYFKVWFSQVANLTDPTSGEKIPLETILSQAMAIRSMEKLKVVFIGFLTQRPANLEPEEFLAFLLKAGHSRAWTNGKYQGIEEIKKSNWNENHLFVLVDRLNPSLSKKDRILEATTLAIRQGHGTGEVRDENGKTIRFLYEGLRSSCNKEKFELPSPSLFSFNSPVGACPDCKGFGKTIEIDENLVIPNSSISLAKGAIKAFSGNSYGHCKDDLLRCLPKAGIDPNLSWNELTEKERKFVWDGDPEYEEGNSRWYGVKSFFKWLEKKTYKMHVRVYLSKYRSYVTCSSCNGTRMKKNSLLWRWNNFSLPELYAMPIDELHLLIGEQSLSGNPKFDLSLTGIRTRLNYLKEVGLGYLSLDRPSKTLSGGETQRVNLTACLGASLTDTLFALDEPTIGLHGQDIGKLINILKSLAKAGNCVCVVEHDEQVIRSADKIIELGPSPGVNGGEIIFVGSVAKMLRSKKSLTGKWLSKNSSQNLLGKATARATTGSKCIHLKKASKNNILELSAKIPLNRMACIAGVSGSGKSTLLNELIYKGLSNSNPVPWIWSDQKFSEIALIDQNTVARTPRSNPVMFADAWGPIKEAFGRTDEAKRHNFASNDFSFNAGNGRCDACGGLGFEQVEMQFLSNIQVPCNQCEGKRFKQELLEIKMDGMSVSDVLDLTIDQAKENFVHLPKTFKKLSMLIKVGLGYLTLGQPLNTLSGGESQRLKLVKYMTSLSKSVDPSLLLIDEPTTGLHFHDIGMLLDCLRDIINAGHSLLIIEHNPQVLENADWIFEMGPGAGKLGGRCIAQGNPRSFSKLDTATARILGVNHSTDFEKRNLSNKKYGAKKSIFIKGARENNLKNISLKIPSNQFVVVTGPSGSGKSSLAFDVLFAEGQRRFMDSMSSYARQFVEQMRKPEVDEITGISPTVAIEQRVTRGSRKSTVGSTTEVAQYLRLLFSKIGTQLSIQGKRPVVASNPSDVIKQIKLFLNKQKPTARSPVVLLSPLITNRKGHHKPIVNWAREKGFEEVRCDGEFLPTKNFSGLDRYVTHNVEATVARWYKVPKNLNSFAEHALDVGQGRCLLLSTAEQKEVWFSTKKMDLVTGEAYPDLEPSLLSWNSSKGWCPFCKGYGRIFDWMKEDLPAHGNWWKMKDGEICPECEGDKLAPLGRNVIIQDIRGNILSLPQLLRLNPKQIMAFLDDIKVDTKQLPIVQAIVPEINDRLKFMEKVGLDYLTLERDTSSLSGGEAQRIRLAGQIGSNLSGVLYVLDEPSIGLHPMDNSKLIESLRDLQSKGNSLIVVEHDQETILQADYLIDVGPAAGKGGGEIVGVGNPLAVCENSFSQTGRYMKDGISHPIRGEWRKLPHTRKKEEWISLSKVNFRNLRNLEVRFPIGRLTICCGVSGSGKSSLIRGVLHEGLKDALKEKSSIIKRPTFVLKNGNQFHRIIEVSQSPIGKTPRSTPATYLGVWDRIRTLISSLPEAKAKGYKPSDFSFNVKGGRCEVCKGAGRIKLEMNFLPDSYVSCQECMGLRYKEEILNLKWNDKNIAEILDLTFQEASDFFNFDHFLGSTFSIMVETGLGYLRLGQLSPTLSGGEAQRLKLASELALGIDKGKHGFRPRTKPNLYILEEPTIGLHTKDCENLIRLLHRLVDEGNTVIVIEHDVDLIAEADFLIELGPEGGEKGGNLLFEGKVENMIGSKKSKTAPFLQKVLS